MPNVDLKMRMSSVEINLLIEYISNDEIWLIVKGHVTGEGLECIMNFCWLQRNEHCLCFPFRKHSKFYGHVATPMGHDWVLRLPGSGNPTSPVTVMFYLFQLQFRTKHWLFIFSICQYYYWNTDCVRSCTGIYQSWTSPTHRGAISAQQPAQFYRINLRILV